MNTRSRRALGAVFFFYAVALISWIPRYPEVKHNLHISNGEFGTLLSLGALGSLVSLLMVGHLVHRYSSRKAITASATILFLSIGYVVHVTNSFLFFICIVLIGAGSSGVHIAVNSQGFYEQERTGENLIPRLHGFWSAGALSTAILSGFLTGRVSLVAHVDTLCVIAYLLVLYFLKVIGPDALPGVIDEETSSPLKSFFSSFSIDWNLTWAITFATMVEFSIGDWGAIFSKEELHMSAGVATIPYIICALAMIGGRLNVHRITKYIGIGDLVKRCVIFGGIGFMVLMSFGKFVSKTQPQVGFLIFLVGVFIGALGSSFLAPTILDAANKRSKFPGSVVIAQIGAVNTILVLMSKTVIAWTAQLTSISVALIIPSFGLMAVAFSARAIKEANA